MEDYPRDQLEFESHFASEEACRDYLFALRWPEGFRCPRCGHERAWPVRKVWFECARCGRQTSVTAGTIFQDTRKPLRLWFRAMWTITTQKNGASALGLQRVLGLGSYQTAWTWMHKLRRAMVRPGRERLVGLAFTEQAAILDTEGARGERCCLTDGVFEGEYLALADVFGKSPRIGSIGARVGHAFTEFEDVAVA